MIKYLIILFTLTLNTQAIQAQIKIDNITLPNEMAGRYFVYLYAHPDTVWFEHPERKLPDFTITCKGDTIYNSYGWIVQGEEIDVGDKAIGRISRTDTTDDYLIFRTGYLIRRKPSADDIIKWIIKEVIR